jgi:hypothetical protein
MSISKNGKPRGYMKQLIEEAYCMLKDRSKHEADLIYAICNLSSEERAGIKLAYSLLYPTNKTSPVS